MAYSDEELINILESNSVSTAVKVLGLKYILGLTATEEGLHHVIGKKNYLAAINTCTKNDSLANLCTIAHQCFINIAAEQQGALALHESNILASLIKGLDKQSSPMIEYKCQTLSNATRFESVCEQLSASFLISLESFSKLMFHFISDDAETKSKYDSLALLFANLSSVNSGKRLFLMNDHHFLNYILPYTTYSDSETRRIGAAILLKNICFEIGHHKWLLEEIDILPSLLLPLTGPEDLDEDEMEKLPIELQYLGPDKVRESNSFVRNTLLAAVQKLCSTELGRTFLREKGAYTILRELHKWETHPGALQACEDVVEILIREESDINCDNLTTLNIPEHIKEKFEKCTISNETQNT